MSRTYRNGKGRPGVDYPLNRPKRPKKPKKIVWFKRASLATIALVSSLSLQLAFVAPRASAWKGPLPACSVDFGAFAWKDGIKNAVPNSLALDPDTVSTILVYRYTGQATGRFQVDMLESPFLAAFTQGPVDVIDNKTPKSVQHARTAGSSGVGSSWEIDTINKTVSNNGVVAENPAKNKYGSEGTSTSNSAELICISTAKGYTHPYNWDQITISETLPTQGAGKCNGALDFGCWVGRAFNGIENTFIAVAQAILKGLAWLWAPDQLKTQQQFGSLNTFLQDKLGFMLYPITFIIDLFNSFTSTANNWCTTSSCVKSFGNFQGQPFSININTGATVYPAIWQYFLAAIRGLTVLGLIFAIRHKYLEIVNK
jgi:hypothetical protein